MRRVLCLLIAISLFCCGSAFAWGENNSEQYENAIGLLKENKYKEAGEAFAALGSYNDSPRYTMYCNAIVAGESGLYSVAVENLKSLSGFLDSNLLALYYAGLSWEASEEYEKALEIMSGITLYRDVATRITNYPSLMNERDYKKADENESAGRLDAALSGFRALGNYKDSAERAASLQTRIDEHDAANAEAARKKAYDEADQAEKEGRFEDAFDGFSALGNYSDSKERAEAVRQRAQYAKGMSLISTGSYEDAYAVFYALGNFEDSTKKVYALGLVDFSKMKRLDETTASYLFHDKYGLINYSDNNVTIPQWDDVSFVATNCFKIKDGKLYGLVDGNGKELSTAKWFDLSPAKDGFMIAAIQGQEEGKTNSYKYDFYLVDTNGNTLTPAYKAIGKNESTSRSYLDNLFAPTFSSGLIRVQGSDGKWGFIDNAGEVKISISYSAANDFAYELAAVKENRWGYINTSGEYVIEPQFATALDFNEHDRAEVRSRKSWHVIDKAGSIVYFEGQPFDEMPADGSAEEDVRMQVIKAMTKDWGVDLDEETEETEAIIAEAGAYFDAMVEEFGSIDAVLEYLGITLE